MDYQRKLLEAYHERTALLDPSDKEKLEWFQFYFKRVYAEYFRKLSKDSSILEIGCNKGYLLNILYNEGFTNLSGVDLAFHDVEKAKILTPQANFFCEDAFSFLDMNREKFDFVIIKAVIEHIKKEQLFDFLEKIRRSLTNKGIIFVDVYNADWLFSFHDRYMDFTHETGFTKESLEQVMSIFFDKVQVVPTDCPPYVMGRKDRLKHYFSKKIVFSLLKWADPQAPSVDKRLLLATGEKRHRPEI